MLLVSTLVNTEYFTSKAVVIKVNIRFLENRYKVFSNIKQLLKNVLKVNKGKFYILIQSMVERVLL